MLTVFANYLDIVMEWKTGKSRPVTTQSMKLANLAITQFMSLRYPSCITALFSL